MALLMHRRDSMASPEWANTCARYLKNDELWRNNTMPHNNIHFAPKFSVEDCKTLGFNSANLLCSTCEKLNKYKLEVIHDNCKECCLKDDDDDVIGFKRYPKAVLEVCTCKFGTYPQIQAFVKSERPRKYTNLQIKYIRGVDPIIKLYNADNKLEDELDIHKWDTDSIDEFLQTHLVLD